MESIKKIIYKLNVALYRQIGIRVTNQPPITNTMCDRHAVLKTGRRDENWGKWSDRTIQRFCKEASDIKGDYAEIGVHRGATFHRLIRFAREQGKQAHAIDSFVGMAEPGTLDRQLGEVGVRPPGGFDVGGAEGFAKILKDEYGIEKDLFTTWEGWVPEVFEKIPAHVNFSLALVDLDHYQPTKDAIEWVWPRLNVGGILLLDDVALGYKLESTEAVNEFLSATKGFSIEAYYNNQLILKKLRS